MGKTSISSVYVFIVIVALGFGVLFVSTLWGAGIILGALVGQWAVSARKRLEFALGLDFFLALVAGVLYAFIVAPTVGAPIYGGSPGTSEIGFFVTLAFISMLVISFVFTGIVFWAGKSSSSTGKVTVPIP